MNNKNENFEEIKLPRISNLIPKSPETKQREQEYEEFIDKFFNDKNLEFLYSVYILKQIWEKCRNEEKSDLSRKKSLSSSKL